MRISQGFEVNAKSCALFLYVGSSGSTRREIFPFLQSLRPNSQGISQGSGSLGDPALPR